jgi:hypothetical protein
MSRLVMLSGVTTVKTGFAVSAGDRGTGEHRIGYAACKDAFERGNIVETRHLIALWRIIAALPHVAKSNSSEVGVRSSGVLSSATPAGRTRGRARISIGRDPDQAA